MIFPFPFQDVMVVGEPSLMGGDFGEEDERLISRLENSQYDPAAAAAQHAAAAQVGRTVGWTSSTFFDAITIFGRNRRPSRWSRGCYTIFLLLSSSRSRNPCL